MSNKTEAVANSLEATRKAPRKVEQAAKTPCPELFAVLQNAGGFNLERELKKRYGGGRKGKGEEAPKITRDHRINLVLERISEVAKESGYPIASKGAHTLYYNGKCWDQVSDLEFRQFLAAAAHQSGIGEEEAFSAAFNKAMAESFLLRNHVMNVEVSPDTVLLNCDNGTLEIVRESDGTLTVESRKPDPKDGLMYVLPYNYDGRAKAPLFQKFLNDVVPNAEDQASLQEYCGYLLAPYLKYEKCLFLYGSTGNNGKTTFKDIITAMLGSDNVNNANLADLCGKGSTSEVARMGLSGKLLNACGEIDRKIDGTAMFKTLVTGEKIDVRRPYDAEAVTIEHYARLMFCCNDLPVFTTGAGKAEARRFIFVGFEQEIPKEKRDPELCRKIVAHELPGILNWSIEGLKRILSKGAFSFNPYSEKYVEQFEDGSNSVAAYIHAHRIEPYNAQKIGDKSRLTVSTNDLFRAEAPLVGTDTDCGMLSYTEWCKDNGRIPVGRREFSTRMMKHGLRSEKKPQGMFFDLLVDPEYL